MKPIGNNLSTKHNKRVQFEDYCPTSEEIQTVIDSMHPDDVRNRRIEDEKMKNYCSFLIGTLEHTITDQLVDEYKRKHNW